MGMDVFGKNPAGEQGKYFRNNVWWWRPLAEYCVEVAPDICAPCKYWQSNDGDGLDADGAAALATALQHEVDENRTLAYALRRASAQEQMPNEPCSICAGSGTRLPIPQGGAGDLKTGGIKCNGCDGSGYVRPSATHYWFSVENVVRFIAFLRESGGFEIC
jgi:hypothetical protein